ncbi:MAG: phage portal protein [Candidatus Omnitrophica bacterium]|jgi:hypothetical protein|nr:phage portal protein [Candidatus Omnitrophota bacterium]
MSWLDIFKSNSKQEKEITTIEVSDSVILANGQDKREVDDPTSKFCCPSPVKRYQYTRRNVSYKPSEYDLEMVANAVSLDGILRRTVNIYVEQILKNGYEINSENDKISKHVAKRLKEIQYFTGISFYELLNQISTQLVTYGNAYVIKERARDVSKFGKGYRLYNRSVYPIVGLFCADASTMEVGLNDAGTVVTYKQEIRGEANEWDERDVIHFTYNKIPGTLTGQSQILPVLDDVRALRKLEEEIEILGFQYSIPLYLYKVGTKEIPPAPGEVELVSSTIANMPSYGMLVVPGHHDITIPSNTNSMDIIKYVDHFKSRIFGGLGVSPVALGQSDTSNRNTAQVADLAMQSITKSYQQIEKNKIELELFRELMLDGGFDSIDDEVEFRFPEIDIETQIKKETHIIAKWQNNLITRTEARNEMDYENKVKDSDTFLNTVDIPKIEAQQKGQMELAELNNANAVKLAKLKPAPSAGGEKTSTPALPKPNSGGKSVTKVTHTITAPKNQKSTSNKVAPANQHGKSTRPKYVKNSSDNIFDGLSLFNNDNFSKTLSKNITDYLYEELDYTINKLCSFYHKPKFEINTDITDKYFSGLDMIISNRVSTAVKFLDEYDKLDLYNQKTKEFVDDQVSKVHNLAKILMYKEFDINTILISADNCDKHADVIINLDNFDYSKLPPFGYQCKCEISEENLNE